jgi:glycosyl transferase family 87
MGGIGAATSRNDLLLRWARFGASAGVIGVSVAMLILALRGWTVEDSAAYWEAAMRIREGATLYPPVPDPGASDVYRYAPWFAYLWVPLTFLPKAWVLLGWTVVLVVASVAAAAGLARERRVASRLLAMLFGSMLIWTAARGNVQPLMILALVGGLPRRTGPLWIGLAASLKAVPLAFVLVYLARRDWKAAAWTVAITAALVAPMPMMGWTPIDPGPSLSLYQQVSPLVWSLVASAALSAAVVLAVRRSRFVPVAAGVAAVLALPRLLVYDITFLAPSAASLGGVDQHRSAPSV